MKVLWTKTAVQDFQKAYEYVNTGGLYTVKDTLSTIESTIEGICKDPRTGKSIRTKNAKEVKVPHTPFFIAYRDIDSHLEILSIFHKSKAWNQ